MMVARPYDNEGRDNMITQGIKRWLQSLFAWWPWKRFSETDYAQTPGTSNMGTTQEALFRTTVDGPTPHPAQSGITSVAVEPIEEEPISEVNWSATEEHSDHVTPFTHLASSPSLEEKGLIPRPTPDETAKRADTNRVSQETPAPTAQQRLEFLRYLVERGIVSDHFNEERE